jgi:IS1 family transposase
MRGLRCTRWELDEQWGYVGKKQRHVTKDDNPLEVGDQWIFAAIDPVSKLVPTFHLGKRTVEDTNIFVQDLAGRLETRCQISVDGFSAYINAIESAFGSDVDLGVIVKSFEAEPIGPGRYSPPKVVATEKTIIMGSPDYKLISTSMIERLNLTTRQQCKRMSRLTLGYSKRFSNLRAALGLQFAHYNLARVHASLRVTPAMEAGVTNSIWSVRELIDASGN